MTKVTVTKFLNVRVGKPSVNAPCYQYLAPGSVLEVDGHLYQGDKYEGIDTWMKDEAENYYWSGGVEKVLSEPVVEVLQSEKKFQFDITKNFDGQTVTNLIDYHSLLDIESSIKQSKGAGTKIALLDTGIFHHPVLTESLLLGEFDFTGSPFSTDDKNGHGTFLSGLICARTDRHKTINGIAPGCQVANIKVIKDNGSAVGEYLESGLNKVPELFSSGIINMSLNITVGEYKKLASKKIFETLSVQFACVAAAGENEQLLAENGIFSPASSENVIAIGSIDEAFFNKYPSPVFDPRLNFIIPQFELVSCLNGAGYTIQPGASSMATAMVSAIIALVFSNPGSHELSFQNALSSLNKLAKPYSSFTEFNSLTLLKP